VGPTQEEINAMLERRQERRRSSIYHGEGSILFAASKVIYATWYKYYHILGTITIPAKSTQQSNAAENQTEVKRKYVSEHLWLLIYYNLGTPKVHFRSRHLTVMTMYSRCPGIFSARQTHLQQSQLRVRQVKSNGFIETVIKQLKARRLPARAVRWRRNSSRITCEFPTHTQTRST
jgi:hypothetical protein